MMKKILFIGQSTKHFSYYESSIRELTKTGYEVVFRFDDIFSNKIIHPALKNYLDDNKNEFKWISKPNRVYRYFLYFIRELRTYSWYLRRTDQSQYYTDRWADLFPLISKLLKTNLIKKIISNLYFEKLLGWIERRLPPSRNVISDIKSISPQMVYISPGNMRYSAELEYLKSAKYLKLQTVVSVLSWDNLTNKGMFHWKPDYFLVWNKHHADELIFLHGVNLNNIKIVGAQLFDKWLCQDVETITDIEINNLDNEDYILYLGSSSNIAEDESSIIRMLINQIPAHENIKIVFKPHPSHYSFYRNLEINGLILLNEKFGLTETWQDVSNFKRLVRNAKCVIGINTSGFIDSIIIGKETYAIISEAHSQTQSLSAHYKLLSNYGVIEEIRSYEDIISKGLSNHFNMKRQNFLSNFIRPNGIGSSAGSNASKIIDNLLK